MCLGVPGRVIDIREERGTSMATVDFGGVHKDVCLAYAPEARIGDYTIIHAGFAITLLDEESALRTLALFDQIGLLEEELGGAEQGGAGERGVGRPAGGVADGRGGAGAEVVL